MRTRWKPGGPNSELVKLLALVTVALLWLWYLLLAGDTRGHSVGGFHYWKGVIAALLGSMLTGLGWIWLLRESRDRKHLVRRHVPLDEPSHRREP